MDEPMGKVLTWEEREKVKKKLAFLKKEYHQTFTRLQRSQKAERVKTHVKKTIEEQNRILSQLDSEMGLTDPEPGVLSVLQASASGFDNDTPRKTSVTFNLEPEVFCIGQGPSTSHLPDSKDDQQPLELISDKTPESTPRSRLKLRRIIATWKETEAGSVPPSLEASLSRITLQRSPGDQAADPAVVGSVSCGRSAPSSKCDEMTVEETAPAEERHGMNSFTSQVPPSKEGVPRPPKNATDGEESHPVLPLDLSTESLESTPSLFISPTPGSPVNREGAVVPSFLKEEDTRGKGSDVERCSYFCISGRSMKGASFGSPDCTVNQFNTQYKHTVMEPRYPSNSSPAAEQAGKHTGEDTTALTVMPECVSPSVTVDSPLNSCTLVEGLLFPVEYYVRTTRRMSSCQSKIDLDAVIQSHLGTNRKGSRKKVKQVVSAADKVDPVSLNQKGPLESAKSLIPETCKCYVGSETTGGTCAQTPSPGTPTSNVSRTEMNNSNRQRKGRRGTSGRGRKKARFTKKLQMDVGQGPGEKDYSHSHCLSLLSSSADSPSQKECTPNKTAGLPQQSCTPLTDGLETAEDLEAVPPTEHRDNTKDGTRNVVDSPRHRNSSTKWKGIPTDDLNDFELGLHVGCTPNQRRESTRIHPRTPGTPLSGANEHLIVGEPSPPQSTLLSCLQQKRGKDQRGCSLNENPEVLDSRASVELSPKSCNSLFQNPEERLSWKILPVTLDIQDFHLPDEEYGLLKLEKLKSFCMPPQESFVYQLPKEALGTNRGQGSDQAPVSDLDNEMQSVRFSEMDRPGISSEQVFTIATISRETSLREPEDQPYSVEMLVQDQTVLREPRKQSYTTVSVVQEAIASKQSQELFSTDNRLVAACNTIAVPKLETQFDDIGHPIKELNSERECITQAHQSDSLLKERVSELDCNHQLYISGALIGDQSPNKEKIFKQLETDAVLNVDDLALSGDSMGVLSTLEWQGSVEQQDGPESTSSFVLMTPVGTDPPDTVRHSGFPISTLVFPTLGPTPALSTSLLSAIPSGVPCYPESQTARNFCSQTTNVTFDKEENDFMHCTSDVKGILKNPPTLQEPSTELLSETKLLRSQAQYETGERHTDMRTVVSDSGWGETSVAHSQSIAIRSEPGQCEMNLHHSEKSPLACEAWQSSSVLESSQKRPIETNVNFPISIEAGGERRLSESDLKSGIYGDAEQNEHGTESAPAVLGDGRERTLKGDLQLLSQIQPSGNDTCAVDLSTVWWDSIDWRALCTVTATKSSVSVWKPLDGLHWEVVYSWNSPQVPIMQLVPLPDQYNVMCVALGHLDIEEIWILLCSPDGCDLSALLVKSGSILAVRGLSGRRVVSSSGTHPDQLVEVTSLSAMGRSEETLVLRSPEETVLSFAEVEGEINALIGSTAANNAVIWNASSGQLLKKIPIGHHQPTSLCLQAYSELGLLFMILSHPHANESESSQRDVLSLIATNPKQALSVHVMSYALPTGCPGRYLEGDLKDHMAVAVLTSGDIALWDLHLGQCTVLLPPNPPGKWSLVKWCMMESHLLAGQKDGSVYVYQYSETYKEKT